jgi:HEAT repeat protein
MQQPRPMARVTLPPRIRPYREWDLEETAVDSLVRIGRPAVPRLVQSLRHPQAEVREEAAQLLARIGPDAEQAVPALVAALQDRHAEVQKAAARALGQIGPAAVEAVEPLMSFVHEGSSPVQQAGYEE